MVRVVLSGTIASVFMGMTGASIGALIWDTATIPFIFSACSGFVLGAVGFYRDAVRKSLRSLDRYPRLLQLHLDANFPHRGFDTWPSARFRSGYFGSTWVLRSMLVASWLTASNAIDVSYPEIYSDCLSAHVIPAIAHPGSRRRNHSRSIHEGGRSGSRT